MYNHTTIALYLLGLLTFSTGAVAERIDPGKVTVVTGTSGVEVVENTSPFTGIFEFSPFTAQQKKPVPGFSNPLGIGADPQLKVFSGKVKNMDVLGDFHPSNPFDPQELEPTRDSVETAQVINQILYSVQIPGKKRLLSPQLDLKRADDSQFSTLPKTSETSPLVLAGFGSVSEVAIPMRLHWTECPDFKRYLRGSGKGGKGGKSGKGGKPAPFCFMI